MRLDAKKDHLEIVCFKRLEDTAVGSTSVSSNDNDNDNTPEEKHQTKSQVPQAIMELASHPIPNKPSSPVLNFQTIIAHPTTPTAPPTTNPATPILPALPE